MCNEHVTEPGECKNHSRRLRSDGGRFLICASLVLNLLLIASPEAFAQQGKPESSAKKSLNDSKADEKAKKVWNWRFDAGVEVAYDNNVYRLSDEQMHDLENQTAAERISGRFDDMESVEDVIVSPSLRVTASGRGFGQEEFRIRPHVRYEYYVENSRKQHPEFGLDLEHGVGRGRSIGLDLGYVHNFFTKNYLADATDLTGFVSADERVYEAGVYDAFIADVFYRQRMWKADKKEHGFLGIEEVTGRLLLGYRKVDFEEPFHNRDLNGYRAGLAFDVRFADVFELDVHYALQYVGAPNEREVVLRDEPDFGADFNDDGDAADNNIRTVQRVDRSRVENAAGVRATLNIAKDWTYWAGCDVRFQNYLSDEPFDLAYNRREDLRHRARTGIEWRFARRWVLDVQAHWIKEMIERDALPAEVEDREYDRFLLLLGISRRF